MSTVLTILSLVPEFLRAISAALASNTSLGSGVTAVLETGAALIEAGDAAATELQALTTQIRAMVAAGRDPTEEEWNALKARSDAAHATIQGLLSTTGSPSGTSSSETSTPDPTSGTSSTTGGT